MHYAELNTTEIIQKKYNTYTPIHMQGDIIHTVPNTQSLPFLFYSVASSIEVAPFITFSATKLASVGPS